MLASWCVRFILASAVFVTSAQAVPEQDCVELPPRQPRIRETLQLGTESTRYKIIGLQPNVGYEVRVSYPATNPAFIDFSWEADPTPFNPHCSGSARRALLAGDDSASAPSHSSDQEVSQDEAHTGQHVDEIAIHLDAWPQGDATAGGAALQRSSRKLQNLDKVQFSADAQGLAPGLLIVHARREGYHRSGPAGGGGSLIYNIELAPTFLGVPVAAFPVGMYFLFGAVVIVRVLPSLVQEGLPCLVAAISRHKD